MDKALGHPQRDPHGDPIPSPNGELEELKYISLDMCEVGKRYVIVRASDDHPEVLQRATKLGLVLNKKIIVKERTPFDQSIVVRIGRKEHFISQRFAEAIFVQPLEEEK